MKRLIFPRDDFRKVGKEELPDATLYGRQTEFMDLLQSWEEKALAVLKESELHNEQKQWILYSPLDIPDGEAREARLVVEAVKDTREALFHSDPCGLALAGIKLGAAVASAHALDFETDVIENRSRKKKTQAGRHKRSRDSRNYCRDQAAAIWKKNRGRGERIVRMGAMTDKLSALLIREKMFCPLDTETIRKWLKDDPKEWEEELIIPPEASLPGPDTK